MTVNAKPKSDYMELEIGCSYSNIGEEWVASASWPVGGEVVAAKAPTRPEALRRLADELENYE